MKLDIHKRIHTTSSGTVNMTLAITNSGNISPKVFAVEVLPASADPLNPKFRFSHVCSPMELRELPSDEPGEHCYFRVNIMSMLFDTADQAQYTLESISRDVARLVAEYTKLEQLGAFDDPSEAADATINMQFSDDAISWHNTQVDTDRYVRVRVPGTENSWSDCIQLPAKL